MIENMTFGGALEHIKADSGCRMSRAGWNGKGMFLKMQRPDEHSFMTFPYPYFTIPGCEEGIRRIPYNPTLVDIMSEDWTVSFEKSK